MNTYSFANKTLHSNYAKHFMEENHTFDTNKKLISTQNHGRYAYSKQ